MAPYVSLVLAFRHPLVALGIRSTLAHRSDLRILAECSTFSGTIRAVKRLQPRVLVIGTDIFENGIGSGLAALREVSEETRVAVLCTHYGDMPEDAFLQGASAVLSPASQPADVITAIETLAAGHRWRVRLKSDRTGRTRLHAPRNSVLAALSARERQIAQGVVVGKRNREIAEAFGISPGTVKLHLNRIYAKVGVNSRLALLKRILEDVTEID